MIPGMGPPAKRTERYSRLAASAGLWLAPLLHVTSFWLMLEEVEPFRTGFYSLAWWSYIAFVAALNHRWRGNSLLFDQWREFRWLFLVSTPAWLFFELCNFRLHNWHYIGVPSEWWVRLPGYFIAFGTVLPGIFETQTLLQNLAARGGSSTPGLKSGSGKIGPATSSSRGGRLALLGGLMLGAALVWPLLFFPLVWAGPVLVLRWLVSVSGEKGLAPPPGRGDYSLTTRLLLSGLICGVLWEFWNFWAGAKWVYTIPYLNGFRVFEMPLAGFLGFPPFALICYLMYRLALAPRVWITARRSRVILMAALYLLCCGTMFLGIERLTVLEYKPFWPW